MSNSWVEKARVARLLSRTGTEDIFFKDGDFIQDFFKAVADHHNRAGVDRRAIATGEDFEFTRYEIFVDPLDGFAEMLWAATASIHIWDDILRPVPKDGEPVVPLQILAHDEVMVDSRIQSMVDGTCHYTFINETDLFRLEEFYFPSEHARQFGDAPYSVINIQDIMAGEKDGFFDVVRLNSRHIMLTSNKVLGKYMDSVKVGGIMFLNEMSGFTRIYDDSMKMHLSFYYEPSKYIKSREDFITYHVPHELGIVIAKRIS